MPAGPPVIDPALLSRAVARGILTAAQVEALDRLAREEAVPVPERVDDDERLRFITGFADIFVTLGIGLFLGAAWLLAGDTLGETGSRVLVAALAWALAEFFTRRRRMALPSIALLAIFAVESFLALASMAGLAIGWSSALPGPSGSGAPAPLPYAGIAFGTLIRDAGFSNRAAPLSFLALGAFVLLLSAGWHAMRGVVLRGLPARLADRLPHPIGAR
ncbi:hypothetical protein MKK64_20060 [Methylobacterium sp. E-025]|uniref:hypothetical protein n=1 Tax=Methylobacterium sp. E-025 TaxID=2836561 RepID=UPI001FBA4597|nr:hypothetical protein [Methylobacterium sp. E-025]MCJ2113470.1 hypothetical protein [Methylobacterium sp. E-025]